MRAGTYSVVVSRKLFRSCLPEVSSWLETAYCEPEVENRIHRPEVIVRGCEPNVMEVVYRKL